MSDDSFNEQTMPAKSNGGAEMQTLPMSELQRRFAKEQPRDPIHAVEASIAELRAFPDFAEKAYYSIPYKDNRTKKTVYVEGPGIKASNAMARSWGNNVSGWHIAAEREDRIIIQGFYFDYETNRGVLLPFSVSRFGRSHEGKVYRLDLNRLHLAIQAGGSKARRNAELAGLPMAFVEMYFAESKRIALMPKRGQKEKSIQERLGDAKAKFAKKYGASEVEIDNLIADKVADTTGDIDEHGVLAFLIGVWNALEDGQANVEAVFGREVKTAPAMPQEKQTNPEEPNAN